MFDDAVHRKVPCFSKLFSTSYIYKVGDTCAQRRGQQFNAVVIDMSVFLIFVLIFLISGVYYSCNTIEFANEGGSPMLLQFNFKNFKSFRDAASLDLAAAAISEYKDRLIFSGNEKALPVAAIFGANASGKSNVIDAFFFMRSYVAQSFLFGGESRDGENPITIKSQPFLFDKESKNKESLLEVYYIDPTDSKARVYQYGFTINSEGITEEWLNYRAKSARDKFNCIFYRNTATGELDLSGIPSESHQNIITALEKEVLLLSLGAKLKIDILKLVRNWFLSSSVVNFGDPVSNLNYATKMPTGFATQTEIQDEVVKYLASFDPSITGFRVEPLPSEENKSNKYKIYALHKSTDSEEPVELLLSGESSGTQKMFALYPRLQRVLKSGGVLVVDELNSRLHPLLLRNVVLAFLNPESNPKQAQLIFTTHDSWLLESNLLRRDEIWFAEKDQSGVSALYSLVEFEDKSGSKVRKDANYEKNYLLGKYGAIPHLESISMTGEDIDGEE